MQNPTNISILPAFGDNYIYLAKYAPGLCFAVDPGDATVVLKELARQNLKLSHILATHHHGDHIGGIDTLKRKTGCTVIGPDTKRIKSIDTVMGDEDTLDLDSVTIGCIATPGHTSTSVCYSVTDGLFSQPVLFTGDTLFTCGCGRVFECDGAVMYASLQKLAALPDKTLMYPGHDYTEENVQFALTFKPNNHDLQNKLKSVQEQIIRNQPTVPSTMKEEKELNPFLNAPDRQTFVELRRKKDVF